MNRDLDTIVKRFDENFDSFLRKIINPRTIRFASVALPLIAGGYMFYDSLKDASQGKMASAALGGASSLCFAYIAGLYTKGN